MTNGTNLSLPAARGPLVDVAVPLVLFYGLRAVGVGEMPALIVGMIPPLARSVYTATRRRSIDALGALVLACMLHSLVVGLVSDNPRQLLVRSAWVSAPLSLWMLATLWAPRPMTFTITRELLPARTRLLDRLWDSDRRFRRAWRHITVVWAVFMLIDAALRIAFALTLPIDVVPALDMTVTVVTIVALQVPTHVLLHRTGHWQMLFGPRRHLRPAEEEPSVSVR